MPRRRKPVQRKRLKTWRWTDEVWDCSVFLLVGTGEDAQAWINRTFNEDYTAEWKGAKTCYIEQDRGCAVVFWFPAWFNIQQSHHLGILAHEAQHGTFMILTERGMKWAFGADEAYNYHTAWLFREIHRRLVRHRRA